MKLKKIEILNFRSFFADFYIDLSTDDSQKITVFIGENGGGKTNLLNAIYWCLTGSFTANFEQKNNLLNVDARDDDRYAEAYCKVEFEHLGRNFTAKRVHNRPNQPAFEIEEIDVNGNSRGLSNPELFIQGIIPKALSNWFFYDAEAIKNLTLDGSEEFKSALRKTLDFDLLEKTIADLDRCHMKKTREIKGLAKPQELKLTEELIENINHVLPGNEEKYKQAVSAKTLWGNALNLVNSKLAKADSSKELQARRTSNENKLSLAIKRKDKIRNQIAILDGQAFPNILINEFSNTLQEYLTVEETKGRVPSPYSEILLKDIIHDGECICGTKVSIGSKEEKILTSKLATATTSTLVDRKNKLSYAIEQSNIFKESYIAEITEFRSSLKEVNEEISSLKEELDDIKKQIESINLDEIVKLEKERDEARDNYGTAYAATEKYNGIVAKNKADLKIYTEKHKALLSRMGLQHNVANELDKIERLKVFIEENLREQEKNALVILDAEINKYLRRYLTKHYTASINQDNYAINLFDDKQRPVPKSTGEGEVLKYAFISAVLAVVGNKSDMKLNSLIAPTLAPLVMDAPFTSLGDAYKISTAIDITRNASQLILMMLPNVLSNKALSNAITPHIGRAYAVISQQTGKQGNKPVTTATIFGKSITFNEFDCRFSGTKIEEISIG